MKGESLAIIGAGKVGTAIGYLLRRAGYRVVALADISEEALERGGRHTGGQPCKDPAEAAKKAEAIFITTVDDAIKSVCDSMAEKGALGPGKRVIHTSGAGGLDLLDSARNTGAGIASIHPLQTFADIESAVRSIPGSTFSITAGDDVRDWAIRLVSDIGGVPFLLADEDKPLYHAAACFASNYLVSLMEIVASLYGKVGLSPEDVLRSVQPLVRGTINNIFEKGVEASLTGPITRGDITTVRKHLNALSEKTPVFLEPYRRLGLVALSMALKKGAVSRERAEELEALLKGDERNE